jgi:hypothetical protein
MHCCSPLWLYRLLTRHTLAKTKTKYWLQQCSKQTPAVAAGSIGNCLSVVDAEGVSLLHLAEHVFTSMIVAKKEKLTSS